MTEPQRSRAFSHSAQAPLFFGVDNIFFAAIISVGWMASYISTCILRNCFDVFQNFTVYNFLGIVEVNGVSPMFHINNFMNRPSYSQEDQQNTTAHDSSEERIENSDADNENLDNQQRENYRGYEQMRMRLDIVREGQTYIEVVNFFQNIFLFLCLFAIKLMADHVLDIILLVILVVHFLQADINVTRLTSNGLPKKLHQVGYALFHCVTIGLIFFFYHIEGFNFKNVFLLNIGYFSSGDFTDVSLLGTVHGILVIDLIFKIVVILPKILIIISPDSAINAPQKRRLLQFIEYCSQLYRCALSFGPWFRYFLYSSSYTVFYATLAFTYLCLKVHEATQYLTNIGKTVRFLFRDTSFGKTLKKWEHDGEICTVCHEEMQIAIKLDCDHTFCKTCIETWLDRNKTCPMCRAVVKKDMVNDWKNGGTSRALRIF